MKYNAFYKAISYRLLGTIFTFSVAFLITGRLDWSVSIGGLEMLFKMFAYYFHEKAWGD